jgi:hypothetical protein
MMSDLRTILERGVGGATPPPDGFERMLRRRDRKRRNQRIAAGVVGIAVFVAAVWVLGIRVGQDATAPADRPTEDTNTPADRATWNSKTAEDVATDFVYEIAFFETDLAVRHLVNAFSLEPDDAAVSGLGLDGIEEFRRWLSFNEATGFEIIPTSCRETDSSSRGTYVRCTFDFHGIRSEAIGRGPYSGSYFDVLVERHIVEYGRILDVSAHLETAKFGPEMWDPFAEWVSSTYPQDAAVMYTNDNLTDYRLTPRSIRLWEKHTREYVDTGAPETGAAAPVVAFRRTDYLLDLETYETTPLPESIRGDWQNGYAVSPDGSEVAYYREAEVFTQEEGPPPPRDDGTQALFVAHIDGTHVRQIADDAVVDGGGRGASDTGPAWSPDGTKIAYTALPSGDRNTNVFVLDLASGVNTQVTFETVDVHGTEFSPDGSSIVYTAYLPGGSEVRIAPATGGKGSTLVGGRGSSASGASFSPDGSLLSYICADPAFYPTGDLTNRDLCLADADGSDPRVIAQPETRHVGGIVTANWSPDGSRLAFWTFDGVEGVYILDVATGQTTCVAGCEQVGVSSWPLQAWPRWLDDHTLFVEAYYGPH